MKRSLMEWRTVRKPARRNWTGVVLSASIATGLAGVSAQSLSAAPQGGVTAPANDVDPAAKKLLKASGLFNSGLFKLAAQEYTDFLQQFPTHAEATNARYALAICNYRQQAYEPAIEALTQVLKDEKFAQRDEALAVLGHCNLAAGKNDKALAAFDELLAKFPQSKHAEVAALNKAQVLYLTQKYKEAAAAAESFATKYPQSAERPSAAYFLALSQRAQDQNEQAAATLQSLLTQFPKSKYDLDATLLLGQALEAQGKFEPAAEQYRKMLAGAPAARQPDGHYSLGVVLSKSARYEEAAKELATVVDQSPSSPYAKPAKLQLGLVQLAAGKTAAARTTLLAVALNDPASAPAARYGLAQTDIADKKYEPALATLADLLKITPVLPNAPQIALDRAVCLAELSRHDEAAKEFAAFATKYPTSPQAAEAQYRQAFSLHRLGKYAESHTLAEKVAAGKSEFASPAAELDAENLYLTADYKNAAAAFSVLSTKATDADKKSRFSFRLGQCAYFSHDYPKAVEILTPLSTDPKAQKDEVLGRASFLVGDALLQQGKYADAATALSRYSGKADKQEATFKLALAQLRSDQVPAAEKNLAAVSAGPSDSPWTTRAFFELGQLAYKQQPPQLEKAATNLNKVMTSNPPAEIAAPTTYLLGWVDFDGKKFDAAAAKWKDLLTRYPKDPLATDAAFQVGVALKEAGKNEEALAALTGYAKANPQGQYVVKSRQLAAAVLTSLKRDDEAKAMLAGLAADKSASDAVLYDLAWSQKATKDLAGAQETYRRLLKDQPTSKLVPAAKTELAELLYNDKKYEEAAQLLESVTGIKDPKEVDPKLKAEAEYRLAWCYEKLNKPDLAGATFAKYALAGEKNPEQAASALLQAGIAYAADKKFDTAAKSLQEMLTKFPQHKDAAVAMLKLGEVQADAEQFDAALKTNQQFLAKFSDNQFAYRAHFGVGWALENTKKYADARAAYAKVIAATNGETAARAQFQTGETLLAEGKFEEAVKELLAVEFVYAYPKWSARALLEAGRAFEQLKQNDEARKQYTLLTTKYKDQPEAELAQARLKAIAGL